MPRIRQYADQYSQDDFWTEVDRRCPVAGIQSKNNSALAAVIGVSGASVGTYKKGNLGTMQIKTLQNLVKALKPNAGVILRVLGYSSKEIKDFARAEAAGNGAVGNGT